ncbi:MAG: selenocysteine-specific translation elongation factor [Acidaminobacteraceae bacterium]
MANIIIGTAGHIDHGKTTLIKRLTGIETDRLEEEKKRGITIDLGFAFFDLPSGKRAGIVDVPGHEKFIKNMLAGASGLDMVLLVVSAEEGVMPQTEEHIDILTLLGIEKGIVVMTKCDLVDDDWKMMISEDIKEKLKGTFLEDSPFIEVSSISGEGMDKLNDEIEKIAADVKGKNSTGSARLPIDRVFTMTGFGTVVTGTLSEGILTEGETLEIFPTNLEAKIRSIQVHGNKVQKAYSGQRVAVNISNLKKNEISRGNVLAEANTMNSTHMIDCKVSILESSKREIANWTRLRLYHGTKEVLCRIVLLDKETLKPGEEGFAQLRLEEQTACKYGDKFVLRFYSPLETVGGGVILDSNSSKHKRFKDDIIGELVAKNEGNKHDIIENLIIKYSFELPNLEFLTRQSGINDIILTDIVDDLLKSKIIRRLSGGQFVHMGYIEDKNQELVILLNNFHEKNTLKAGIAKEEIRSKNFDKIKNKFFDEILELIVEMESIKVHGSLISLKDFAIVYSKKQQSLIDNVIDIYKTSALNPPNTNDLNNLTKATKKDLEVINNLIDEGRLVKLNESIIILSDYYELSKKQLIDYLNENSDITLAQFRDLVGTSRKIAVPLIEYFDNIKLTVRVDDKRKLK